MPEITKFIDAGGNVLLTAGSNVGDAIRDLVTEVGFEIDEDKTEVIDHHNFHAQLVKFIFKSFIFSTFVVFLSK